MPHTEPSSDRQHERQRGHPHDGHGHQAARLRDIPAKGWKDVALRVKEELQNDRISMVAAGIAFYGFLAIFPTLTAVISIWGLFADPADVQQQLSQLSGVLPESAQSLLGQAASRIAASSPTSLGLGVVLSLLVTLWSANKGMKGLVEGVTIAYDESHRKRGFIAKNSVSLLLTVGAILLAIVAIALVVALPAALGALGLGGVTHTLISVGRWPLLALVVLLGLAVVYRIAPPRENAKWRWLTPGALVATVLWLVASIGFSYYTANFGSYDKTYGSVAAVAILLVWFFISAYIVLLGAEVNCESEKQTARDTTTGRERPVGERGAAAADDVEQRPTMH